MMDSKGYIIDLGLIDYKRAWEIQHSLWSKRVDGRLKDTILILEHPHVITLGRRGNHSNLLVSKEFLEEIGIPIFHVERGGDVTYHGPGQMVIYPIMNLKDYGYRLIRYIDQLEDVILHVLEDFGISGRKDPVKHGVWVNEEKIASVGVAVKRWVSFHGISLNCETDLKYFEFINPCGLKGVRMTSMERILKKGIPRDKLFERVHFHFKEVFKRDWEIRRLQDIM